MDTPSIQEVTRNRQTCSSKAVLMQHSANHRCTYLPDTSGSGILILPMGLPILDLGSIGQVHD